MLPDGDGGLLFFLVSVGKGGSTATGGIHSHNNRLGHRQAVRGFKGTLIAHHSEGDSLLRGIVSPSIRGSTGFLNNEGEFLLRTIKAVKQDGHGQGAGDRAVSLLFHRNGDRAGELLALRIHEVVASQALRRRDGELELGQRIRLHIALHLYRLFDGEGAFGENIVNLVNMIRGVRTRRLLIDAVFHVCQLTASLVHIESLVASNSQLLDQIGELVTNSIISGQLIEVPAEVVSLFMHLQVSSIRNCLRVDIVTSNLDLLTGCIHSIQLKVAFRELGHVQAKALIRILPDFIAADVKVTIGIVEGQLHLVVCVVTNLFDGAILGFNPQLVPFILRHSISDSINSRIILDITRPFFVNYLRHLELIVTWRGEADLNRIEAISLFSTMILQCSFIGHAVLHARRLAAEINNGLIFTDKLIAVSGTTDILHLKCKCQAIRQRDTVYRLDSLFNLDFDIDRLCRHGVVDPAVIVAIGILPVYTGIRIACFDFYRQEIIIDLVARCSFQLLHPVLTGSQARNSNAAIRASGEGRTLNGHLAIFVKVDTEHGTFNCSYVFTVVRTVGRQAIWIKVPGVLKQLQGTCPLSLGVDESTVPLRVCPMIVSVRTIVRNCFTIFMSIDLELQHRRIRQYIPIRSSQFL